MTSPEKPAAGRVRNTIYQFNARGRGTNGRGGRLGRGHNVAYRRIDMDNTSMQGGGSKTLLLQDNVTVIRKRQSEENESSGSRDDSRDSKKKKADEEAAKVLVEAELQPRGSQ